VTLNLELDVAIPSAEFEEITQAMIQPSSPKGISGTNTRLRPANFWLVGKQEFIHKRVSRRSTDDLPEADFWPVSASVPGHNVRISPTLVHCADVSPAYHMFRCAGFGEY